MQTYAIFTDAGLPAAFYNDELFPPDGDTRNPGIPAGAIPITAEQWQELIGNQGLRRWDGTSVVAYAPPAAPVVPPDSATLSDWRVGLILWGRIADVTAKVTALSASTDPQQAMIGRIAGERLEYANSVLRAELLQLQAAFGFSEAEVDESLYRAQQVSLGDLSGVWPLPAAQG